MKYLFRALPVLLLILTMLILLWPMAAGGEVQLQTDQNDPSLSVVSAADNLSPVITREPPVQNDTGTSELFALSSLALVVGITVKLTRKHKLLSIWKRFATLFSGANYDRRTILNCPL